VFEGSGREIAAWLERCAQAPGTGGILDLRGADGDDLDALREVAARLAPAGSDVFEVRGANGRPLAALRTPTNAVPLDGLTLVVLADGETGGASEALAALLKGRAGVLVAGTPTRGDKGLMEYIPLSDTEVLYVATRWLFTPEGRPVSGVAVTPDVPVRAPRDGANVARLPLLEELLDGKPVSERAQRDRGLMERVAGDAVLERAVDMLLGLEALDLDTAAREPR
jgi:C-terminal processing protease CtpA/Prc